MNESCRTEVDFARSDLLLSIISFAPSDDIDELHLSDSVRSIPRRTRPKQGAIRFNDDFYELDGGMDAITPGH